MPIVDIKGVGQVQFPDNMSQDEIAEAIQRNLNPSKAQKVMNGAQGAWDAFADSNIGSGILGIANGVADFGQNIAYGAAQPVIDTAIGSAILGDRALSTGSKSSTPSSIGVLSQIIQGGSNAIADKTGMQKIGNIEPVNITKNAPDPMLANIASIPASFFLPGSGLMKGQKGVNALLTASGLGAGYGAIFGASQDPNSDILNDSAIGAAIPAGLTGIAQGLGAGANAVKGAFAKNMLTKIEKASDAPYSSISTPEELAQKLAVMGKDVPIDLGTLVNDVKLANKYKKSSNIWGSGNEKRMEEAVKKTDQVADLLAAEMSQGVHDEATGTEYLLNHIKKNYGTHKDEFKILDDELSALAKNRHIDTSKRPNSERVSTELLDELAEIESKGGYNFLSNDKNMKKLVENIKKGGSPLTVEIATGEGLMNTSLPNPKNYEDLKNLRSYVGQQIGNLKKASFEKRDNEAIGKLGEIYYALDDDMGAALQAHPDMLPTWEKRSSYYKTHVKPYEKNNRIADIINSDEQMNLFTKLNSTDKDIKKVISDMSPQAQKLLLGLGFKGAIKDDVATGAISGKAAQIASGYTRLNNSPVLKHVLDEKDHDLFKKLVVLQENTKDYRPLLKNPETGAKNTKMLAELGLAIPTALGLGAGAASGSGLLPAAGAALGTGAYVMGKNALSAIRGNPKIAEAYANPSQRNRLIKEAMTMKRNGSTKEQSIASKVMQKALESSRNPAVINYLINDLGK